MTIDLTDKVVLVTGASRGIGAAVAARCGEAGATVAVHYGASRTEAEALAKSLPHAAAFQANLAHPEAANQLFEAVLQRYGRVDVLVNNAGVSPAAPLDASDETWLDVWTQTIDVNLRAAALLARAAVRHWLDRDEGGRLVTVASRASFRGDTADFIPYAASKAGLIGLTRSIARAFGKQGIVAFDVAPGFTRTDMAQTFIDRYGEAYLLDDIALPSLTEPDDVARIILFLASGLADHATGTTIDINAGSYVH